MANKVRHICGISGGKDSSALAVYMRNLVPEMEYFFCDTGAELPETYEYLDRLEVSLGKKIERLNSTRGFDHYFELYRGTLPSPQMRWCTTKMKIEPIEAWIGEEEAISYIAIRADEANRKGYVSTKKNIKARFPFVENGIDHAGVLRILDEAGIATNLPSGDPDPGVLLASVEALNESAAAFISAAGKHRHLARETDPPRI